jgi:ribosomal protein S18 acetylase RimI-like enzyme
MTTPAFRVREAIPGDNAGLLDLDRQCVVSASTPVAFDRTPEFFARSRPYAHWRVFVAEAGSAIVGVGAMALKAVLVDDNPVQAAYFYDLRVAPQFRRLGVAKAVGDAIREYTRSLGPALGYSMVMEGNVASLSFVQGRGSEPRRTCGLSLIPVETVPPAGVTRLRALDAAEGESVLRLTRSAHPLHDLFPFPNVASLRDRLARLEGIGFSGLYGWEEGGRLAGCMGVWDYSPVMRMRILQAEGDWSWTAGRDLHLVFLTPLGFHGSRELAETVRLAATQSRQHLPPGATRALAIPHDLEDPAYAPLCVFHPMQLRFTLFGLELTGLRSSGLGSRPVYVDPADL